MDSIQLITTIISILTTAIVGGVLSKQIRSQKDTIKNLNDYINSTSWKDVKEYYEEFKIDKERQLAVHNAMKEFDDWGGKESIKEGYAELISYFYQVMKNLNDLHPGFAKDRILNSMPRNAKFFRDIWEKKE